MRNTSLSVESWICSLRANGCAGSSKRLAEQELRHRANLDASFSCRIRVKWSRALSHAHVCHCICIPILWAVSDAVSGSYVSIRSIRAFYNADSGCILSKSSIGDIIANCQTNSGHVIGISHGDQGTLDNAISRTVITVCGKSQWSIGASQDATVCFVVCIIYLCLWTVRKASSSIVFSVVTCWAARDTGLGQGICVEIRICRTSFNASVVWWISVSVWILRTDSNAQSRSIVSIRSIRTFGHTLVSLVFSIKRRLCAADFDTKSRNVVRVSLFFFWTFVDTSSCGKISVNIKRCWWTICHTTASRVIRKRKWAFGAEKHAAPSGVVRKVIRSYGACLYTFSCDVVGKTAWIWTVCFETKRDASSTVRFSIVLRVSRACFDASHCGVIGIGVLWSIWTHIHAFPCWNVSIGINSSIVNFKWTDLNAEPGVILGKKSSRTSWQSIRLIFDTLLRFRVTKTDISRTLRNTNVSVRISIKDRIHWAFLNTKIQEIVSKLSIGASLNASPGTVDSKPSLGTCLNASPGGAVSKGLLRTVLDAFPGKVVGIKIRVGGALFNTESCGTVGPSHWFCWAWISSNTRPSGIVPVSVRSGWALIKNTVSGFVVCPTVWRTLSNANSDV